MEKREEKKTVLYITDMFYGKGGAEKNLLQLAKSLDRSRYTPMVVCLNHGKLLKELSREGIFTRELGMDRVYGFKALVEAVRLFRLIREHKVSIVVSYHEASDFWGGIVARLAGVPVVLSNRRDMGYKLRKHHIYIYRALNRFFDRIIVVSEAVRDAVSTRQKVLWHKLVTVYNGVETGFPGLSAAMRARVKNSLGLKNHDWLVIGTTGSIRSVKGHRFFIEAASIVLREFPRAYFLIVGRQDDAWYLSQLNQTALRLGIRDNLVFCGHKSNILQIVQSMDICVSASLSEGMSNAVLEYMACGKPVVATRVGGNPEVVEDGVTGFLVPSGDPMPLARAITSLIRDKALRERMGEAGKESAVRNFSVQSMLRKVDELYTGLLEEKKAGPRGLLSSLLVRTASRLVKVAASHSAHYSGISFLFRSAGCSKGIRILAFHRIAVDSFDPLSMCVSPRLFEHNMRHIRRRYSPLSLEEAVCLLRERKPLPEDTIVVTLDDGYRDNYLNAYPILKRYKIPATLFLSVEAVESGSPLWYDLLVQAIKRFPRGSLDLWAAGIGSYRWGSDQERESVCRKLVTVCKHAGPAVRREIVDLVLENLRLETGFAPSLMLDWRMVNAMRAGGVSLGSHGMTHSALRVLGPEALEHEAGESKRIIFERTGVEPKFFANPYGDPADFSPAAVEALKRHGYEGACSLCFGPNVDGSTFTFRRFCVSPGMLSGISGRYSARVFDMHMLPLGRPVRFPGGIKVQAA